MGAVIACDLDRTLVYSARALWLDGPDALAPSLVVTEVYQGAPLSFMTRESERLLAGLRTRAEFVPVTTRTAEQYARIRLAGETPRHAIVSNGGTVLVDGRPDEAWARRLREEVSAVSAPLAEVATVLNDPANAGWVLRVHVADDLFLYAIVDREAVPADWVASLAERCRAVGWTVSLQGRKLYCVPAPVTKQRAVAALRERLAASIVLAAGDSLLDRPMLEAADIAYRPAHGELDDAGYLAPRLTVTEARGVLAGEEILRRMGSALDDAVIG